MADSLVFNWVSSYLMGSIPNIREIISKKKDVESRINECYQKALKRWTDNEYLRDMVPDDVATVDSLKICDIELIQYKFAIRESADSMVENFVIVRLILTFAKNSELWLEQLQ